MRLIFFTAAIAVLIASLVPPGTSLPGTGWDKANHVLAFGVLGALGTLAYPRRARWIILVLVVYGSLIELLQSFTPYRFAEFGDLLADIGGAAVGCLIGALLNRLLSQVRRLTPATHSSQE